MAVESREANKRLKNYHEASEDELEEEEEEEGEDDRGVSTDDSTDMSTHSSRCGSPPYRINGDKKKKNKSKNQTFHPKLNYKCIGYWKENHGHPIFGVSVNHHLDSSSPTVFATVGYNRVTIYEAMVGGIKLLQCYADPDTDENFYTCAW
jgi:polycomb protein EED